MAKYSDTLRRATRCGLVLGAIGLATSCTNDGDIGHLYGKWQLQGIEAISNESRPTTAWQSHDCRSYLNFQDRICQIQVVDDQRHELASVWGTFTDTADSLILRIVTADYVEGATAFEGLDKRLLLEKYLGMNCPCDVYYDAATDEYHHDYHYELHFGYVVTADKLILTNDSTCWSLRHYGF